MKARNAFEASGNSPTHGHGVESVRRRIMEAFERIRQHPVEPPTPPQPHEFVYTEQHEERFRERAKKLALALLACTYVSKTCNGNVWEIKAATQTAEELINEILRGSV
jgi:hypothetical protein